MQHLEVEVLQPANSGASKPTSTPPGILISLVSRIKIPQLVIDQDDDYVTI